MGFFDTLKRAAGFQAGAELAHRAIVEVLDKESAEERKEREARQKRTRLILLVVGSVIGIVLFIALAMKLVKWAILAALVGGLGYGLYALARPKVAALFAGRREAQAKQLAAQTEQSKAQKLEDDLAALRKKAGR